MLVDEVRQAWQRLSLRNDLQHLRPMSRRLLAFNRGPMVAAGRMRRGSHSSTPDRTMSPGAPSKVTAAHEVVPGLARRGICQTSCPLISCGVSDFRGAVFVFGVASQTGPAGLRSGNSGDRGGSGTVVVEDLPAWAHREWRGLRVSRCPGQPALGVTKRIALCRCVPLYQLAKDFTPRICKTLGRRAGFRDDGGRL